MFSFLSIKDAIYVGIIMVMVGSTWYVVNDWHYKPLDILERQVVSLEAQLTATGSLLNVCESNLSKQLLKGFIDGIGEHNEDININLDNLST